MESGIPAIKAIGEKECAGCFACFNICPFNALTMKLNDEGFYVPEVNSNCRNCGLCQKVCPVLFPPKNEEDELLNPPLFYAGWSLRDEVRLESSSGGIFSELAEEILRANGVVFGVAWHKGLRPFHFKVSSVKILSMLRGSKYLQSYVGKAYLEVVDELKKGRKVLFSGTPCQVAAIKKFVPRRSELISCGVVCHGVPSMLVFEKYCEELERKRKAKLTNISFRVKKKGWRNYAIMYDFSDGSSKVLYHGLDPFYVGYLRNLYLRSSCYDCVFSNIPRIEDITLGDFWGVPENLRDERGVSLIVVNTLKGKSIIDLLVKKGRICIKEVDYETGTKYNPRVICGRLVKPLEREKILEEIKEYGFSHVNKKYINVSDSPLYRMKNFLKFRFSKLLWRYRKPKNM